MTLQELEEYTIGMAPETKVFSSKHIMQSASQEFHETEVVLVLSAAFRSGYDTSYLCSVCGIDFYQQVCDTCWMWLLLMGVMK